MTKHDFQMFFDQSFSATLEENTLLFFFFGLLKLFFEWLVDANS